MKDRETIAHGEKRQVKRCAVVSVQPRRPQNKPESAFAAK